MIDAQTNRPLSRRTFGTRVLGALTVASLMPSRFALAKAATYMIDTHSHVFHRGLKLADARRYAPDYDAPLELYLRQLDENGITNGVLVQPSFLGTDNSYLVDSLVATKGRVKGIAVVEPNVSTDELTKLHDAGIVGIRLNLIGKTYGDFRAPPWTSLLDKIAKLDWQVEVQNKAADLAIITPQLVDAGVKVVLDHYMLPDQALGINDPAFQALLKLASSKRVWVKISAPYRNGPHGEDYARQAYPLLREAFGLDHLLWGSDWPHTQYESTQSYKANLAFFEALVPEEAECARIFSGAKALFGFA